MASNGRWVALRHDYPGLPSLLTKFTRSDAGYSLSLTDLTYVWVEKLSTIEIAARAEETKCSINPSDDVDQLRILLAKIEAALDSSEGTFIDFDTKATSDYITLILSTPLPKPLPTFKWRVHLTRAEPQELTASVISPMLLLAHRQQKDIAHLLEELHHRDHVIGKLLDRMATANLQLHDVFLLPHVKISKRKPQREQFARYVRGLTPFEPSQVQSQAVNAPTQSELQDVLAKAPEGHGGENLESSKYSWWQDMANLHTNLRTEASMDLDGEGTEDDEFQTQEMPGRAREKEVSNMITSSPPVIQATAIGHQGVDSDAETADEDEPPSSPPRLDNIHRSATPPSQIPPGTQPQFLSLGLLGEVNSERGVATAGENFKPSSPIPAASSPVAADRIAALSTQPPANDLPLLKASPRKRRLGLIGSQRGSSQAFTQTLRGRSPSVHGDASTHRKYEPTFPDPTIEHQDSELPANQRSRFDKYTTGEETSSQIRETSEDRANRKRSELKAQLQTKAPAKKKRRF